MPDHPSIKDLNDIEAEPILPLRPSVPPASAPKDRRRPGRMEHVSPELIGLLRARPGSGVEPGDEWAARTERDDGSSLGAARGILLATVVGLLLWAGVFWIVKSCLMG